MAGGFERASRGADAGVNLGAIYLGRGKCRFQVWAPLAAKVAVHLLAPKERLVSTDPCAGGYHQTTVDAVEPGALYRYRLDGDKERPDPASRFQPQGVHGPSQVTDPDFPWEDGCWFGLPLRDYIIYELHVGTFTPEGTFEAIIPRLEGLFDLGVTALELMPVAQFPGNRNWGYDGVYPFAVQNSYGGPVGLKKLVNACHRRGLAVILDVVYNHLGPEGNYQADFAPYFTERYKTPWGHAVNFDGAESDHVRRFFIDNAIYWIREFHMDALRLDAVHAILDHSPQPFLEDLSLAVEEEAQRLNRRVYAIAESAANDSRLIRSRELGGYGLSAQWSDDFHHCVHTLLTGERGGYYQDFGVPQQLLKAFSEGFVYSGEYSPYRRRRHGSPSKDIPAERFVVFTQNHDQVGNRMRGERLSELVPFEALKLAAGLVMLSPFIPLVFMGEEYGEKAPFQYFVSHSDPALVEAVRKGRQEEFAAFGWKGEIPDPQDEATFMRSRLHDELRHKDPHRALWEFYRELIRLRKTRPSLSCLSKKHLKAAGLETDNVLVLRRRSADGKEKAVALFHFGESEASKSILLPEGCWHKQLDSAQARWRGPGSSVPDSITSGAEAVLHLAPYAVVLFTSTKPQAAGGTGLLPAFASGGSPPRGLSER